MGMKPRRSPRVWVELDVALRGSATVLLERAEAARLERQVARGEEVPLSEIGAELDWNDVASGRAARAVVVGAETKAAP